MELAGMEAYPVLVLRVGLVWCDLNEEELKSFLMSVKEECVKSWLKTQHSGWGTHVYLWQIHFDIWQNQYNIVKLKNKIKIKKE